MTIPQLSHCWSPAFYPLVALLRVCLESFPPLCIFPPSLLPLLLHVSGSFTCLLSSSWLESALAQSAPILAVFPPEPNSAGSHCHLSAACRCPHVHGHALMESFVFQYLKLLGIPRCLPEGLAGVWHIEDVRNG